MQINFTTKALENLTPKAAAYIAYHASGERGTGRVGVRVYPSGRKTFVYRHFVGKTAKFQTLGEYPSMSISSALEKFESLSSCPDVIKVSTRSGTLADLFDAHKADFIASGKRTYHHFESLRSTITASALLPESTIAKKITTNDIRAVLNFVYQRTQKRAWVNQVRTYMHTLFAWGVKCDKSPLLDKPNIMFDIPFNAVSAIPVLEVSEKESYVGERYLSFEELSIL